MKHFFSSRIGYSNVLLICWLTTAVIVLAGLEDYHQYLPPPFARPALPSRDYLKKQTPLSPWQVEAVLPDWRELASYQEKKEALSRLAEEEKKARGAASATPTAPDAGPTSFGMRMDPSLPLPSLFSAPSPQTDARAGVKPHGTDVPEVTTSPWMLTPNPTPQPVVVTGEPVGGTPGAPRQEGPAGPAWIRKPAMGGNSDLYLPFSFTPGYNPPAPASAVIYSQPDAKP